MDYSFKIYDKDIEVVKEFKYLGVPFSRSGSFYAAKKHNANQAQKAMFNLIKKSKSSTERVSCFWTTSRMYLFLVISRFLGGGGFWKGNIWKGNMFSSRAISNYICI